MKCASIEASPSLLPCTIERLNSSHTPEFWQLLNDSREGLERYDPSVLVTHRALENTFSILGGKFHTYGMRAGTDLVGSVTLRTDAHIGALAYLSYFVSVAHWNKGYASTSVSLLMELAFEELGFRTVLTEVMEDNGASQRVLRKNRFVRVMPCPALARLDTVKFRKHKED